MQNLLAILIASMVSMLVRDALPPAGNIPFPTLIAMCVFIVIFPVARRFIGEIRPE